MIQRFLMIIMGFFSLFAHANDGAFYASGNHLIPIQENNIALKKEVLTLDWQAGGILVRVEYILDNPDTARNLLVGFEAKFPEGDADIEPKKTGNPYITNFSVVMNGEMLDHQVAIIESSDDLREYYKNNPIKPVDLKEIEEAWAGRMEDFRWAGKYVYYFEAPFKKGRNSIIHEYFFENSASIGVPFDMHYILTAANRWAGEEIGDFMLIINGVENKVFYMTQSFFESPDEWEMKGETKILPSLLSDEGKMVRFKPESNEIRFHKNNFTPQGELEIFVFDKRYFREPFDYREHRLDSFIHSEYPLIFNRAYDEESHRILRNLPFAARGYTFKTHYIQHYYDGMDWYKPNPDYVINLNELTPEEKQWLDMINAQKQ